MPLDRRLRDDLRHEATTVEPDVERLLRDLETRSTARPSRALGVVGVAIAVLLVVVGVRVTGLDPIGLVGSVMDPDRPSTSAPPTLRDPAEPLVGTYTVRLDGADPQVDTWSAAGPWRLRLGSDSTVQVEAPAGFRTAADGPLDRDVFAVQGRQLFTNLWARQFDHRCAGSGTYTWDLTGDRLTLAVVEDACQPRVVVLTTRSWTRDDDGT